MSTSLGDAKYVSLETFRKDGNGVKTPMWVAPLDGKLVFGTEGGSFKVKRIRNNPRVRIAICNANGQQILGPWHEGTARILEPAEAAAGDAALNAKYGILRRAMGFFSKLARRKSVLIEVTLTS
jgi:uncharacterized protein